MQRFMSARTAVIARTIQVRAITAAVKSADGISPTTKATRFS